ncbi:MAG: transcriptional regulatory protein [Marmoricola sp.]|nr:transcriptional regulatory protein [Marmoricola sp.]
MSTTTDEAILEAALQQIAITGARRTSADDIARRAGVNRVTLYRRLGGRDAILAAAYLQETARVLGVIEAAIGEVPEPGTAGFDPADYVVDFFSVTIKTLRGNRILRQLLETDREATLVSLTFDAGPTLAVSSAFCADRIRQLRAHLDPVPPDDDVELLSLTLARLAQSLLLTQTPHPSLRTRAQMTEYAELVIVPMVLRGTAR